MRRFTIRFVIALLTFFFGVATVVWLANRSHVERLPETHEVALIVKVKGLSAPDYSWIPIYFEEINGRVKMAGLPDLATAHLPEGDLEVRVWRGFGVTALEGLILKRDAGLWSSTYLSGIHPRLPRSKYQRKLQGPKSGWEGCWQRLVKAGLLTLPDDSILEGKKRMLDGLSYVVEIKEGNNSYRTYRYSNPAWQDWEEAERMIEIGGILSDEFVLPELSVKK